jgi:hypothetical protein
MQHLGERDRARKWQRKSVENEQETIDASPFLLKASIPFLLLSCPCRERGMLCWRNETTQVPCAVTVGLSLVPIVQTCSDGNGSSLFRLGCRGLDQIEWNSIDAIDKKE